MNISKLKIKANSIRKNIIEIVYSAKSGHIGGALGLTDIFTYLYFEKIDCNLIKKKSDKRNFVFLSNGHTCPVLYSTLFEKEFFSKKDLLSFRKLGGKLQGHPHFEMRWGTREGGLGSKQSQIPSLKSQVSIPGIENSGGSLGQGISQAVGLAHSLKRDGKKNRVYCFIGDGELEEGQVWEALLYAGNQKLNNLTIILDRNHMQIDGDTKDVLKLEPLNKKITAFNLSTIEFDGHNFAQIKSAFKHAEKIKKTTFLIANTIPGKGVSFMENNYHWHGKCPNEKEYDIAIIELDRKEVGGKND